MKEKKILITGGAGYIGSHANKTLHANGSETVVFDNLVYGHREFAKWGKLYDADLSDKAALDSVFKDNDISAVLHFAAYAYVGESVENPRKYYTNNVCNTLNLLNSMIEHGVGSIIFSSTCATYGNPVKIPIPETHPQNPINPYGQSKLTVEKILSDYHRAYGLRYMALRYFNAAGADPDSEVGEWHEPETHLIPLVLDAAIGARQDIRIFGTDYPTPDGTCIRDYIHVTDLADAHVLAVEYLKGGGESGHLNLGNGDGFSVREVIEAARKITGREILSIESDRRPGDPPALVGSAQKAREALGWKPRYNGLENIIGTAWEWRRKLLRDFGK